MTIKPSDYNLKALTAPEALQLNLALFLQAMKENGVDRIKVAYEGQGDEGEVYMEEVGCDFSVEQVCREWEAKGYRVTRQTGDAAAMELANDIIAAKGHEGWENGHGGYGFLTVTVKGEVTLEHYDYVMDTVDSQYSLKCDPPKVNKLPEGVKVTLDDIPDAATASSINF